MTLTALLLGVRAVPFTFTVSITLAWAELGAWAESAWVLAAFQLVLSVFVICLTLSFICELRALMLSPDTSLSPIYNFPSSVVK